MLVLSRFCTIMFGGVGSLFDLDDMKWLGTLKHWVFAFWIGNGEESSLWSGFSLHPGLISTPVGRG